MAGRNRFIALKQSATKLKKFDQAKHILALRHNDPHASTADGRFSHADFTYLKDGICLGLAVGWIAKRASGGGSALQRKFKSFFGKSEPERIAGKMASAAASHLKYMRNEASMQGLLKEHEIQAYQIYNLPRDHQNARKTDLVSAFSKVCTDMDAGSSVLMSVSFKDLESEALNGHFVGLHKNSNGDVHFFDGNAGTYKVRDPERFIQSWIDVYTEKFNVDVTMASLIQTGTDDGFFECKLNIV